MRTLNFTGVFPLAGGAPHSSRSEVPVDTLAACRLAPGADSSSAVPDGLRSSLTFGSSPTRASSSLGESSPLPPPPPPPSDAPTDVRAEAEVAAWLAGATASVPARAEEGSFEVGRDASPGARLSRQRAFRWGMEVV